MWGAVSEVRGEQCPSTAFAKGGRIDGKTGIPAVDQPEHADYEMELAKAAESSMDWMAEKWHQHDVRLKADYDSARIEVAAAKDALAAAEVESGKAKEQHSEALTDTQRVRKRDVLLGRPAYIAALTGAIVVDVPFNAVAFRVLQEPEISTLVVAVGIAAVLLLIAHFLPISYKRGHGLVAGVGLTTVVGAILGIAAFRESYMRHLGVESAGGMDPRTATIGFVALSFLVFFGAAIASFYAHDPDPEVEAAHRALRAAVKRLRMAAEQLARAIRRLQRAEEGLATARARREKLFAKATKEAEGLLRGAERLIHVYRLANMRAGAAKRGPRRPISFNTLPEINIPAEFRADYRLDWDALLLEEERDRQRADKHLADVEGGSDSSVRARGQGVKPRSGGNGRARQERAGANHAR
jgi:hypothetical protein